nr:1,4-alpha-glucan branching protein GlgB [Thermicanus aegyptius]
MKPSQEDIYLFHEGTLYFAYLTFGSHPDNENGMDGVRFTVWAPHARSVRVVGDFNRWCGDHHEMEHLESGIWHLFIPSLREGELYKYEVITAQGERIFKADPFAFSSELKPKTASVIVDLQKLRKYPWGDQAWQEWKREHPPYESPMNIYEVHFGTWKRKEDGTSLTYREMADSLIDYVSEMGYTHIELLPLMEHPYDRSWGYQITGYYAITSRYGSPEDFQYFVDRCHQKGIGVILDWVPSHFVKDEHGLGLWDGTPLYEYAETWRAENEGWGTLNFDLGKGEVHSFLISNAIFYLDIYHVDGIRVDAVASMLYRDYGKKEGDWVPNQKGGKENLEGIEFLRKLNKAVFHYFPHTLMVAEDSTAWPLVTAPTYAGGLGFNFKWNMGWMNDMLRYMGMDPIYRKHHHNLVTFSFFYAFSENFILPISHDEVVYGKRSLLNKMPGDYWQKFASFRAFLGYMMTHPGKKLLMMGTEFAQWDEWKDESSLDWFLLDQYETHRKAHRYMKELNHFYLTHPALWEWDHKQEGFQWIDANNRDQSILVFTRRGVEERCFLLIVVNFTPVYYESFRIGVPIPGEYKEVFNSDRSIYGGSKKLNSGKLLSEGTAWHGQKHSLEIKVPPLSCIIFEHIEEVKDPCKRSIPRFIPTRRRKK